MRKFILFIRLLKWLRLNLINIWAAVIIFGAIHPMRDPLVYMFKFVFLYFSYCFFMNLRDKQNKKDAVEWEKIREKFTTAIFDEKNK